MKKININNLSFIRNLDIYGIQFPLRYKKNSSYSTKPGIIFSIITFIIAIIIIIYFGQDVIKQKNFSIISSQQSVYHDSIINLSNETIFFVLTSQNGSFIEIDYSYLNITSESNNHIVDKEDNFNLKRYSKKIELEKCNSSYLKKYNYNFEVINENNINKFICIKPNQNLTFFGRYGDKINGFNIIEFFLSKCKNGTNFNYCQSNEKIDDLLKKSYFQIFYFTTDINHFDIKNPIFKTLRVETFQISPSFIKRYYYYLTPSKYESDNGLLLNSKKKYNFFEYEETNLEFVEFEQDLTTNEEAHRIIEVVFTTTGMYKNYVRTLVKIQDIFAKIGGILNFLFLFFQTVTSYFAKKLIICDITNTLISNTCKKTCENFCRKNLKTIHVSSNTNNKNNKSDSNIISLMENKKNNNNKNDNLININKIHNKVFEEFRKVSEIKKKSTLFDFGKANKKIKDYLKLNTFKEKQSVDFSWYEFLLPNFILKKFNSLNLLNMYRKLFEHYLSIEIIIPTLESFSKIFKESTSLNILMKDVSSFHVFKRENEYSNSNIYSFQKNLSF